MPQLEHSHQNLETSIPEQKMKKTKKRVSFLPTAYVVLIPTTAEYHNAGLAPDLWWGEKDYRTFKSGAIQEIQEYLHKNPQLDVKKAVKKFYQELSCDDGSENAENVSGNTAVPSKHESDYKTEMKSNMTESEEQKHVPVPLSLVAPRSSIAQHSKSIPRTPADSLQMPNGFYHQSAAAAASSSVRMPEFATKTLPAMDYNSPPPLDHHSPFEMMNLISRVASMVLGSMVPTDD